MRGFCAMASYRQTIYISDSEAYWVNKQNIHKHIITMQYMYRALSYK